VKPKKPKRNVNADLLDDIYLAWLRLGPEAPTFGEYAARRGVLKVCAATVPDITHWSHEPGEPGRFRAYLCRLARGAK